MICYLLIICTIHCLSSFDSVYDPLFVIFFSRAAIQGPVGNISMHRMAQLLHPTLGLTHIFMYHLEICEHMYAFVLQFNITMQIFIFNICTPIHLQIQHIDLCISDTRIRVHLYFRGLSLVWPQTQLALIWRHGDKRHPNGHLE